LSITAEPERPTDVGTYSTVDQDGGIAMSGDRTAGVLERERTDTEAAPSARAAELAARFDALNAEIAAAITGCTDEEWRRTSVGEGWPVGTVAHHIAIVQQAFAGIMARLAAGGTYSPQISWDEINRGNAEHARDFAAVGKAETLAPLSESRDTIAQLLRNLSDAQFDHIAGQYGDHELSVAQVVERVVIAHAAEHMASIRATLAG
jgi:uncharacterized damage-inducible protein DinB